MWSHAAYAYIAPFVLSVSFIAGFYLIRWRFLISLPSLRLWKCLGVCVCVSSSTTRIVLPFFKWLRIDVLFMLNIVMHRNTLRTICTVYRSIYYIDSMFDVFVLVLVVTFNTCTASIYLILRALSLWAYQTITTISENNIMLKHTYSIIYVIAVKQTML